jgi:hypothetical protein
MRLFVIGPSGCGKTYYIKNLVRKRREARTNLKAPITPIFAHDPEGEFEDLADKCFCTDDLENSRGSWVPWGSMFIIDEAPAACPSSCKQTNWVRWLMNRGRKRDIDLIVATQRPHEVNPAVRHNCTHIVFFRIDDPEVLAYITKWRGSIVADKVSKLGKYQYLRVKK